MSKRKKQAAKRSQVQDKPAGSWSMFSTIKDWLKGNYGAARNNKHRRRRLDLGGTADAHYRSHFEYWKLREEARAMDRDDMVIGQMVDRAVKNIVGRGPRVSPQTGDRGRDNEIKERMKEWSKDVRQVDMSWRHTLNDMRSLSLRHMMVDGDACVLPMVEDGKVMFQLREGQDLNSPENRNDGIVHGVELDSFERPIRYHFIKGEKRNRKRELTGRRDAVSLKDFESRDHFDADGLKRVFHILDPKRTTQTRGVTVFKALFDTATQLEDAIFAKLIQTQISSCVALFIERESDFQFGDRDTTNTLATEEIAPGLILRGRPGEKPHEFAPKVNSAEWRQLILLLLRIIGINVGLPLSLGMLTTSDTTFHGYRGETQQAQIGFLCVQQHMAERFDSPLYAWKIREWFPREWSDPRARKMLLRHDWQYPGFPYVDPTKDVEADIKALSNNLNSPRRVLAARGLEHRQVSTETVEDNGFLIRAAIEEAKAITEETGVTVHWREVAHKGLPPGVSVSAGDPIDQLKRDTDVIPEDHEIEDEPEDDPEAVEELGPEEELDEIAAELAVAAPINSKNGRG